MMMAAPTRREDAPEDLQPFVPVEPRAGLILMWESWLRHEVLPAQGAESGSRSASILPELGLDSSTDDLAVLHLTFA